MKRNKKQQYRVTRYELNDKNELVKVDNPCLLYTSPSPRD